jgi:hypothetical protein
MAGERLCGASLTPLLGALRRLLGTLRLLPDPRTEHLSSGSPEPSPTRSFGVKLVTRGVAAHHPEGVKQEAATGTQISMSWTSGGMVLWGAACLGLGYRVRAGKTRTFYARYRRNILFHNAAFVLIPFGVFLVSGGAAIASADAEIGIAVALLTPIAFVALILSVVWLFKPPEFLKPRWLRKVESGTVADPESQVFGAPSPSGARRIYVPPIAYRGLWTMTAVVIVLWLVLDFPAGMLVGIGAAISLLAAHTPTRRSL